MRLFLLKNSSYRRGIEFQLKNAEALKLIHIIYIFKSLKSILCVFQCYREFDVEKPNINLHKKYNICKNIIFYKINLRKIKRQFEKNWKSLLKILHTLKYIQGKKNQSIKLSLQKNYKPASFPIFNNFDL